MITLCMYCTFISLVTTSTVKAGRKQQKLQIVCQKSISRFWIQLLPLDETYSWDEMRYTNW